MSFLCVQSHYTAFTYMTMNQHKPHCSHKIKTRIIIPSIQNQNSLLVKWQIDSSLLVSYQGVAGGWTGR